eukprot:Blabericola_migrator_1__1832@NODE_1499_length_4405_cov_78_417012_g480_i1_p3_GENE_NODE_1499_length_4405_cov_78_417012_g480_i1NODE_1499_length_4405_cov_78_417012_g480_i1_p3_ORF_typecomplete_len227_score38_36NIF/PF03031_18/3_7e06ubiquitin/PF00240_23/0_0046UN_NPL4/PF11543_8/0_067Poty_PP/PF08440_10/3_7e02Poty_PP/PF08440_10/0_28Auxin_inducible/PF02519_14/1_9e03Auxin_inducible/PF02519_14/68Auxin_inducible/PF02519_14/5_2Pas_Saposin/PF09016_10/1Pas_Saposin/PF09016_10/1_7e03_NODE_1499_length_4405_cov_78_4
MTVPDTLFGVNGQSERIVLKCKWRQQILQLPFTVEEFETATLADLRQMIQEQLDIPCDRQTFLNLEKCQSETRVPGGALLKNCHFKPIAGADVFLVGTPSAEQLPTEVAAVRVLSNEQLIYDTVEVEKLVHKLLADPENVDRLNAMVAATTICMIRAPRPGKKLLVLDIDYTIYDCKGASKGYPIGILKRPFLHQFLEMIHPHFDLGECDKGHGLTLPCLSHLVSD